MKNDYQIDLPYAFFYITVCDFTGKVLDAAPIGKWMVGKHMTKVRWWVENKGGTMKKLPPTTPSDTGNEEEGQNEDK